MPIKKEDYEKQAKHQVDYVVELANMEQLNTSTFILEGLSPDVIIQTAINEEVSLIIMSPMGDRKKSKSLFGSIVASVIDYAKCPVLIVK